MGRENKGHEERCRKAGQGEAKRVCVCVHTHTRAQRWGRKEKGGRYRKADIHDHDNILYGKR